MKKYRILSPLILSLTSALFALGSPSILSAQQPELVYRLGLEQRPTSPTSWAPHASRPSSPRAPRHALAFGSVTSYLVSMGWGLRGLVPAR